MSDAGSLPVSQVPNERLHANPMGPILFLQRQKT